MEMKMPLGFKLWFAFCAVAGLGVTVFIGWLLLRLVNWVVSK